MRVHEAPGRPLDEAVLTGLLGEAPLPLHAVTSVPAPWLAIDGRIHTPTSYFLWHHSRTNPNQVTARRLVHDLADWLAFLVDDRGHPPCGDARDPVIVATEDDFAAYYRLRQYGQRATRGAGGECRVIAGDADLSGGLTLICQCVDLGVSVA